MFKNDTKRPSEGRIVTILGLIGHFPHRFTHYFVEFCLNRRLLTFSTVRNKIVKHKKQKFWYKVVSLRTHLKVFNAQKMLISPIQGDVGMKNAHFKMPKIYVYVLM